MVDLHCHILPGIDDGPKTVEESIQLVKMELDNGVDTIAVTPHFSIADQNNLDNFVHIRNTANCLLQEELRKQSIVMNIIQAAEVLLSTDLPEIQGLDKLQYAGTDYMLVELPFGYYYDWIPHTLYRLQLRGITPIIAHVERFEYLFKETKNLQELVDTGCLTQINASFLLNAGHFLLKRVYQLYAKGLIHFIVSDAHSMANRPPLLKSAMSKIGKKWDCKSVDYFCCNAQKVIENSHIELLTHYRTFK